MNPEVQESIEQKKGKIHKLCYELKVRELRLFGSALSDRFDPDRSDLDFVADFHQPDAPGIADRFMALATGLESIFDRHADIVTRPAIKNPVFRRIIEETSIPLYAA
jgi:predicted nucleotidyltransferase